ncbi:uncharacterized protein BJ212DRAFT_1484627 [Suillus subaureus]|uniref:Myb/SANT-like domain-containing protein n=1 Tax=Suillus subaureus TaxID=48587 RepID=A0A9P7E2J1_9AGAM|nr:uncharacterized protein BJ212DRAFT_1484627 [Suillus subaureus]KAG1809129.1 hypothetical protein BJ212DRAFT_1484627 [Suillus subaureus]
MAQPEVTSMLDNAKAHWQDAEVDVLLHHLIQNRAAGGDGGNFTMPTFNSAAAAINDNDVIQTIGPPKMGKMVKTKWTLLKKIFNQIEIYRNVSVFHWDNVRGAGIKGTAAASVWDTYVDPKSRAAMRPFCNKGWALLQSWLPPISFSLILVYYVVTAPYCAIIRLTTFHICITS